MAGYFVSKFDWQPFADLVSNADSEAHTRLAEHIVSAEAAKSGPLAKMGRSKGKVAEKLRKILLAEEWYAGKSSADVLAVTGLLSILFRPDGPIELHVEPVDDEVPFEAVHLIVGGMAIDAKRSQGQNVFYRMTPDVPPRTQELQWFGNRPFRYAGWDGSNMSQGEFEETAQRTPYSIHSPDQVRLLDEEVGRVAHDYEESPFGEVRCGYHGLAEVVLAAKETGQALYVVSDY